MSRTWAWTTAVVGAAWAGTALAPTPAHAEIGPGGDGTANRLASLAYCDAGTQLSAEQRDRLLRFSAVVKDELARSGARVVLIARSGLDLRSFGQRYSHAGVALLASPESPWAVRQLYYACDEKVPRIFDQGMSAFLMGTDDAAASYVSIVFVPDAAAAALERQALDKSTALGLLGGSYSANAYPFSTRHQNCNQWLLELLAASWGAPAPDPQPTGTPAAPAANDANAATAAQVERAATAPARAQTQRWLQAQGYAPTVFDLGGRPWLWAAALAPWLHLDDHPEEALARNRVAVTMPESIEAFVRERHPQARRLEICHDSRRVVLRQGWEPIAEGCQPGPGDEARALP
jgi:hypothetical protein